MDPSLNINHFSTFPYGGAGNAALSIHRSQLAVGLNSRFFFRRNDQTVPLNKGNLQQVEYAETAESDPSLVDRLSVSKQWARRIEKQRVRRVVQQFQRHLENNDRQTEVFSQAEEVQRTPCPLELRRGVLHLHWVGFGFDWATFFSAIPDWLPIVWTLHDQNPFTGGCHYTTGCSRFENGCGQCPQVLSPEPKDVSRVGFRLKQAALLGKNLHVVSPSLWLLQQSQRSPIFSNARSFHHIPYGLDTSPFAGNNSPHLPQDDWCQAFSNQSERGLLPTVLLGAQDLSNRRKGIGFALEAVSRLAANMGSAVRLWTIGNAIPQEALEALHPGVIVQQWGYIENRMLQSRLYRYSDVFLLPSLEDNQPQMALEAMAHQTPVVAFNVGGIGEVVRDGLSGFCVPTKNVEAMADRCLRLFQDLELKRQLGTNAKKQIQQEHDFATQARQYASLYREIMQPESEAALIR